MTSHASRRPAHPGRSSIFIVAMKYEKKPISIAEQLRRLEERGLQIIDRKRSCQCLHNISYYRLRAYTYPFQNNEEGGGHLFVVPEISFQDIVDLYEFDSHLRSLLFNAIEKIEVALRTRISLTYSVNQNDGFWFLDSELYHSPSIAQELQQAILREVDQSKEEFIDHYKEKYGDPHYPPAWMTLEVVSMGKLSKLYSALDRSNPSSIEICRGLGLRNVDILANWMYGLSHLRNICAHHGRVWNRRFIKVRFPRDTTSPFLTTQEIAGVRNNKLFAYLSIILYLLQIVSPDIPFKQSLQALLQSRPKLVTLKDMGFPQGWSTFTLWKSST